MTDDCDGERERGGWFFQIRGDDVEWAESIGSVNDQRGREGGMEGWRDGWRE